MLAVFLYYGSQTNTASLHDCEPKGGGVYLLSFFETLAMHANNLRSVSHVSHVSYDNASAVLEEEEKVKPHTPHTKVYTPLL